MYYNITTEETLKELNSLLANTETETKEVEIMSKKMRKPRPQPPKYAWLDLDNCWFCKHRNGCSGCQVLKRYVAEQKKSKKKYKK